jgi:hypothetical protein
MESTSSSETGMHSSDSKVLGFGTDVLSVLGVGGVVGDSLDEVVDDEHPARVKDKKISTVMYVFKNLLKLFLMLPGYTQAVSELGLGREDSRKILSSLGSLNCCEIVFGLLSQPIITTPD